ncbi:hypothetical protein [Altererythrobacter litoralis]|uniref:Uncharacterized protein n=1 Tax=Altererythrobacter litoralis TaxID=3113904 RepID=A0ABU7GF84_9SPHN|nr:hypothetical protein [Erythrobacteraceae bacterium 1XM1-14]
MSKKGGIQTRGSAWGSTPEELNRNMRKSIIDQQWHNFQETNDLECLAQICEHADYFGNEEVGVRLAGTLRDLSRRKKGYDTALDLEWALRAYDHVCGDPDWKGASKEACRLRVAEILGVEEAERQKWSERLRKKINERNDQN